MSFLQNGAFYVTIYFKDIHAKPISYRKFFHRNVFPRGLKHGVCVSSLTGCEKHVPVLKIYYAYLPVLMCTKSSRYKNKTVVAGREIATRQNMNPFFEGSFLLGGEYSQLMAFS